MTSREGSEVAPLPLSAVGAVYDRALPLDSENCAVIDRAYNRKSLSRWAKAQEGRSRGFTLIELLVSMTILAGLLAVTYSGFSVSLTMWEKSNERAREFEQRQTVLSVLRDQVAGALPLVYSIEEGVQRRQRIAFEGQANRLRFVSGTSWRDGTKAVPRWIELRWNGMLQVDEREMLSPLNAPANTSLWHLELDTFQELRFRFLRRAQGDRRAEWLDAWDMEQQREFPAAVAIEIKAAGGEARSLVIPLDYAPANWKGYQVQ